MHANSNFFPLGSRAILGHQIEPPCAREPNPKKNQVETLAELEYGVKTNIDVVKTHGQTVGTLSILWSFYGSLWWV